MSRIEDHLSEKLEEARQLRKARRYQEALELCNEIITAHPKCADVYRIRSYILARTVNVVSAIKERMRVLLIDPTSFDHFDLGRWSLSIGILDDAIEHLTNAIEMERRQEEQPCTQIAYLFRAETYLQKGQPAKALQDSDQLRDAARAYIPGVGLRSKLDLRRSAEELETRLARRNMGT
jgi:tetratricopeptide (TPR) repeat protein